MRKLNNTEWDLAGAGSGGELRTVTWNEIPRIDGPPEILRRQLERSDSQTDDRALIPLHWLPPQDDLPQLI